MPDYLEYDPDFQEEFNDIINDLNVPESDSNLTPDVSEDSYLNMELVILRDRDGPKFATVKKRSRYRDGLTIVRPHNNPILDTRMCKVQYKDCQEDFLEASAIEENMFAQFNG